MENGIERRRDPRAPLSLPVKVKTPQGVIKGKTANISICGLALLLFLESPDTEDVFEITIKISEDHEAPITCEKIWTGPMDDGETVYIAIGVRFIKISNRDQKIIAGLVAEYLMA